METVVIVLMILVSFNFMLKLTYNKWWWVALIAAVCFLFTGLLWPVAIEQSKTQIAAWLTNPALMLDTSVVLTIEVGIQMAFCMLAAHIRSTGPIKRHTLWTYKVLRAFPGVLILPVLFSILVELIFRLPGVSFPLIGWSTAAGVLVLIPLGTWLIKWLLPEKDLRLELLFLSNALVAILGVIATVNGRTAVRGVSEVEWGSLGGVIAIVVIGSALGLLLRAVRVRRMNKCLEKK